SAAPGSGGCGCGNSSESVGRIAQWAKIPAGRPMRSIIPASQQRGNPNAMRSPSANERAEFTIGELAREFDVTPRTIRFYEDHGLLAPRREGQRRIHAPRG